MRSAPTRFVGSWAIRCGAGLFGGPFDAGPVFSMEVGADRMSVPVPGPLITGASSDEPPHRSNRVGADPCVRPRSFGPAFAVGRDTDEFSRLEDRGFGRYALMRPRRDDNRRSAIFRNAIRSVL